MRLICLIIGYAIGCLPVAYTVSKKVGGIDIRKHESGNAGATNVMRVLGVKTGLFVFAMDVLKGMSAFIICTLVFKGSSAYFQGELGLLPGLYGGLGAILGHDFPLQFKGRGGKGSAATIGVIFWLDWRIAILCYISGFIAVAVTRYISVASMLIAVISAFLLKAFGYPMEAVCIATVISGLSLYQHRGNIIRLFQGKERKVSFKK